MSAAVVERKNSAGSSSIDEKAGVQDHALPVADFDVSLLRTPRLRGATSRAYRTETN
jgi:hypothetical protein